MSQFTERAKKKIIIPIKPILTGIKAWVLLDNSYFMHWIWHAKGNSPQEIKVPKPLGKNKIVAVVLTLLNTLP